MSATCFLSELVVQQICLIQEAMVLIYCLYQINASGQFGRVLEFQAEDDLSAIAIADSRRKSLAMQLWSAGKLVKQWPAIEPATPK